MFENKGHLTVRTAQRLVLLTPAHAEGHQSPGRLETGHVYTSRARWSQSSSQKLCVHTHCTCCAARLCLRSPGVWLVWDPHLVEMTRPPGGEAPGFFSNSCWSLTSHSYDPEEHLLCLDKYSLAWLSASVYLSDKAFSFSIAVAFEDLQFIAKIHFTA